MHNVIWFQLFYLFDARGRHSTDTISVWNDLERSTWVNNPVVMHASHFYIFVYPLYPFNEKGNPLVIHECVFVKMTRKRAPCVRLDTLMACRQLFRLSENVSFL